MEITMQHVKIRDLYEGFKDDGEKGIFGYNGKLNIRPPYQREFVYKDSQRDAVIETVSKGYPLNIMYWAKTGEDSYEVLDGQQRTISICSYVNSEYTVDLRFFHNLNEDEQNQILDYELTVYVCEGTDTEKLEWFKIVNIAGVELSDQELRNAVYAGSWLEDAKRYFSKSNAVAQDMADGLMTGSPLRQDYLETALKWISHKNGIQIEEYMAKNQHASNANELWFYFSSVIEWVRTLFPNNRKKEMKNINWGLLYNTYHQNHYDANELEEQVSTLMQDEDVTKKSGIYYYVFDNRQKHLNIRAFNNRQRREAYERQKGYCTICNEHFNIKDMEADHIIAWSRGGETVASNCQMLCRLCNATKSNK